MALGLGIWNAFRFVDQKSVSYHLRILSWTHLKKLLVIFKYEYLSYYKRYTSLFIQEANIKMSSLGSYQINQIINTKLTNAPPQAGAYVSDASSLLHM